jgi:glycosyltransferase involved in cell wall biosynthesis
MDSSSQHAHQTKSKDVTLVALILGDFWLIERPLSQTFSSMIESASRAEILAVYDGPQWEHTSIVEQFRKLSPHSRAVFLKEITDLPAVLLNRGLEDVNTQFCTFVWPGSAIPLDSIPVLSHRLKANPGAAGVVSVLKAAYPPYNNNIHFPFMQCVDGASLQGALLRTDKLRAIGGADPNPIFQSVLDWDVLLRLSEQFPIDFHALNAQETIGPWREYPFCKRIPISDDQIHRCIVKQRRYRPLSVVGQAAELDLSGLPKEEKQYIETLCASQDYSFISSSKDDVIRITVTGGIWEPHHNQLCFYNYFELPEGRRQFHWKPILDYLARSQDIEESDLVIISRGRCPNVRNILDWCESAKIPTLYMIDDNWFTVASDWNAYADLFSPGRPDYEMFLEALRRCTATVVYSPVLEGYVLPHAKRVMRIQTNILLDRFLPYWPATQRKTDSLVAGYMGSLRYTNAAFEGLAEVVRRHFDVKIFYFGDLNYLPDSLRGIAEEEKYLCIPYTKNYAHYAKRIAQEQPDVLLAPLDNSATSRSKCFNKYLEITAAGSTGIYTGIPPYTEVVRDGYNGLLIDPRENDNPRAWTKALEKIHGDRSLCKQMARNALDDVKANFDTSARYPEFLNMIRFVISCGRKDHACG